MNGRRLTHAVLAQAWMETRLTLRRGESVLVTLVIPVALLAFFASARVLPANARTIEFLLPGTLALAVISTGLVSLGIATAYERYYGVLKRMGATPMPRGGLVTAKLLSVLVLECLQFVVLVGIAAALFGWRPRGSLAESFLVLILGTMVFTCLGLAMAGSLRAEATLAGANGLFLLFLLLGGLYVPLDHLPGLLAHIARVLPAYALVQVLRTTLGAHGPFPWDSLWVLLAWAVAAPAVAARTFRWE